MSATPVQAALLCYHDDGSCEWTYWDSRAQARQAEAELAPCGPACIYVHSVVRLELEQPPAPRLSA